VQYGMFTCIGVNSLVSRRMCSSVCVCVCVCEMSGTHTPNHQTAHTDSCKTYHTAYTTLSLRMNPRGSKHVVHNRNSI